MRCPRCDNELIDLNMRIFDAVKYKCKLCGDCWYYHRTGYITYSDGSRERSKREE